MNRRIFALVCGALVLCGIFARGWAAVRNPIPDGDGVAAYIQLADNLNRGLGFNTFVKWTLSDDSMQPLRPEGNRQPLMPLMLALAFRVSGPGMLPAQIMGILIGLAVMGLSAAWAAKQFGRNVAWLVLAYVALDPPFIWFSAVPHSHMLYIALFYLTLLVADRESISWRRTVVLGVLAGLCYLARTQGILLLPAIGLWLLLRGGGGRWLKAVLFLATALLVAAPWFLRNCSEFGHPTYSQNVQFLLNENHWSAWSIRDTPPSPMDMLRFQGPVAAASFLGRGVVRVLEPFTIGGQQPEVFAQPTLAVFVVLGSLALMQARERRKMLLPLIAITPVLLSLTLHEHAGRYMMIAVPVVVALGGRGLEMLASEPGRRRLLPVLLLIGGLTLLRPFLVVIREDGRARASEAMEAAAWIRDNAPDSAWVCTYPSVDTFVWIYRKPTLTWPNDYEMLLWPYLQDHGVRYLVVDPDLTTMRPWLSRCWRRSPDGMTWAVIDPPPFLSEVWRTTSGRTLVYEFCGPVPEGYMAVDSLPRDNMRALPPSGG